MDALVTSLFGLIGVLVGGIITYILQVKWQFIEDRRDALGKIMDWLDEMDYAVSRVIAITATDLSTGKRKKGQWPDLKRSIVKLDLPRRSRRLLPMGVYQGMSPILEMMDTIYKTNNEEAELYNAMTSHQLKDHREWAKKRKLLENQLGDLNVLASQYRTLVEKEFARTYNLTYIFTIRREFPF